MAKTVFMIDGWFMRRRIYDLKTFFYCGPEIRKYCLKHLRPEDSLYRIYYYDTEPLDKKGHNPVTGDMVDFSRTPTAQAQAELLKSIKRTPNFALRLGKTVWRNNEWFIRQEKLKDLLEKKITVDDLEPNDVSPLVEQKVVDMKIGLDIAHIALRGLVDVMIVISGDVDLVPALKLARREGLQVGLDPLHNPIPPELSEHVDFISTKI